MHPYVLLNFSGRLDDAFTMAHELGHAMHSYLSDAHQNFANHDYRILAAEVASTVNEVLLTKYLLKQETDQKRRAYLLNHFLEGFRTTVFRQTLFAEFEREAHDLYQRGQALTAQSLSALYHRLNAEYYPGVKAHRFRILSGPASRIFTTRFTSISMPRASARLLPSPGEFWKQETPATICAF